MALAALRGSAGALAGALPADAGGLSWRELSNRLEAFDLFRRAGEVVGLPAAAPLGERVARALALDPWSALFVAEGLGHAQGADAGERAGILPAGALIPLHTGLGLRLAEEALAELEAGPSRESLERFARRCRSLCRDGCEDAALEQLGLAARALAAHRLGELDRLCAAIDPDWSELFWHGVGRGLYFAPMNVLPWGDAGGRALTEALGAPHAAARRNAVAGLGWAQALVNFRHPQVLEGFFVRHGHRLGDAADAFGHGIAMAALTWTQVAGRDDRLTALLTHPAAPRAAALWDRCVRAACEAGFARFAPELHAGRCGGLFRYRPLLGEAV